MREALRQLIETEKVDGEIDRLGAQLESFPGECQLIAKEIRRSERAVAEARATLEQEELEERRLESKMRDQEELILRLNHQTGQVSSNQAYTALQHELDAAGAAKAEFETLALEHMEAIDRAGAVLASARQELQAKEAVAPEKTREIEARRKQAEAEHAEAVSRRDIECVEIDAKLMKRYLAIRKKKRPAIALLNGNACPQCKIVLPRVRLSEVRRLEDVFECSSCKRLLAPASILDEQS